MYTMGVSRLTKKVNMPRGYVIVKNAAPSKWKDFFEQNPMVVGVLPEDSAHLTRTGKDVGLKPVYGCPSQAQSHLIELYEQNPKAGYAICPLR